MKYYWKEYITKKLKTSSISTFFVKDINNEANILTSGDGIAIRSKNDPKTYYGGTSKYLNYVPSNNNILVNDKTKYMIASVSKTITFTALTILMDKGYFDLDDDISVLYGKSIRHPQYPDTPITYRMLYTHRSSIKNFPKGDWR